MQVKQIKDPIYGYVAIPTTYFANIIDTNVFQRLRNIIQTSYSPLYPSAIHNRFIHSIGVFHLGEIASDTILKNPSIEGIFNNGNQAKKVMDIFKLACLLHDVGHAPFSHTGENYFLDNSGEKNRRYYNLHNLLSDAVGSKSFSNDVPQEESNAAAPHEIMSAIIGIEKFNQFFTSEFDKEFFARCITGYKYSEDYGVNSFYNSIISLLNSKVIDVDKLDYLIRDAYFTGFETVNIDYLRLLTSLTIVEKEILINDEPAIKYEIAYNKNAVSIIENVVYAHDAERKWIQTHPIVLYDMYIIQHIMNTLDAEMSVDGCSLFGLETLSPEGITLSNGERVSLLCDDDIVHFLKKKTDDELCNEFFSRDKRRHPLWKSEAEYKAFLSLTYGGDTLSSLENAFDETEKYLRKYSDNWIINPQIIDKVESELKKINESPATNIDYKTLAKQKKSKETILNLMKCLKDFSDENDIDCDFIILKAGQFYSGFNKSEFGNINIAFNNYLDNACVSFPFEKVVSVLNSNDDNKKDYFYLFFKNPDRKPINKKELCKKLYREFM